MLGDILFVVGLTGCCIFIFLEPRRILWFSSAQLSRMPVEETKDLRVLKRRDSIANLGLVVCALIAVIGGVISALSH